MSNEHFYLNIRDLSGGMNNTDEPQDIADNQVTYAENIDWTKGTLGGKRAGSTLITTDASVVARALPVLDQSVTGTVVAGTSINIVIPAITDDGTGTSFLYLIVKINHKSAATAINSVVYGAAPLANQSNVAAGASGNTSIWALANMSLAGGTVTITFAANVDGFAVAEVWKRVDQISNSVTASATSTTVSVTQPSDPTYRIVDAVGFDVGVTAAVGPLQNQVANGTSGTARLAASYANGVRPNLVTTWTLSGSVIWGAASIRLRGALSSNYSGFVFAVFLMRHTKTENPSEDELWMVDNAGRIDRRVGGTWQTGVPVVNQYVGIFDLTGYDVNGASLHSKFFLAGRSAIDGLLVWDGTILRHAGFPMPPTVPTVTDTGAAGTYGTTRYFRIRYIEQSGGVTLRRSEPSTSVAFVPSGVNTGAVITKPSGTEDFTSFYMNGQTHWEVEASMDNAIFYRIATVAIGTATYTDTTAATTGYSSNTISDLIGENTAPTSVRHVTVDEDRLIMGGNRVTPSYDSRIMWTPVESATGVGNDERVPATTGNFLDLDAGDGGGITALVTGESGNIYPFKLERTYKLSRTGILEAAYRPQTESRSLGATKRGAVSGQDQDGSPCVYFTDYNQGLCRVGKNGIEQLGEDVKATWEDVAAIMINPNLYQPRLLYWPLKKQVWISVATTDQVAGRFFLVFNAKYSSEKQQSYAKYTSAILTGGIFEGVMFPDNGLPLLPFWAMATPQIAKFTLTDVYDINTTGRYRGYWTSKAYILGQLYRKFGIMAGVLFAQARASTTIGIGLIRNLGRARRDVTTSIAPSATETHVFKPVDNQFMSECHAVQLEVGDPSSYTGSQLDQTWVLDELVCKVRLEDEATS